MFRPISSGLSPNTTIVDVLIAIKALVFRNIWNDPIQLHFLKKWFAEKYNSDQIYLFNSGRSSLYVLLKSAGISNGDEVIVQAFTCVGAISPVVWVGAKPVYVDIDRESYGLDPDLLEKSISPTCKAVIVQHTFGIPAKIREIRQICRKHKLILIEDCALAMGAKAGEKDIGTYGDASFFSFGRDKVVSSVSGGIVVINKPKHFLNIESMYADISAPDDKWIYQQLLHPIVMALILPVYRIYLGKILLVLFKKMGLIVNSYQRGEVKGVKPDNYPQRYSSALVPLIMHQLKNLEVMNNRRRLIASSYGEIKKGAIYLRYPVLLKNREALLIRARKLGVYLGTWYSNVIDPVGTKLSIFKYKKGSCPVAEGVAEEIINLPTYPRLKEAEIKKINKLIHE